MTHGATLAIIQSKTQTSPEEFKLLAVARNFITQTKIMDWLKSEFELEHGHATMISRLILPDVIELKRQNKLMRQLFKGPRADWLPAYYELTSKLSHFGNDVKIVPTEEQILLQRSETIFGIIKVTSHRLTIGINLLDVAYTSTFISASPWTEVVTHCVHISLQQQINDELIDWLKAGYARAL